MILRQEKPNNPVLVGNEDNIRNVIIIKGVRIEFSDGWDLIRASNTQPVLVMRFKAETKEKNGFISKNFEKVTKRLAKEEIK